MFNTVDSTNILRSFAQSMQKTFNFKLLVPPRSYQGSALKPMETALNEDNCAFSTPVQGYDTFSEKQTSTPFPSKMGLPTKTPRADNVTTKKAAVIPMEKDETALRSSQLFSRLLDEAEKIKMWKFRIDSETLQKDRKLQENKKTIETQRKAIQELQFANESLSMKLEDQLNENEDLRNKSNATRNLCNILKDTFERSVLKMNVFEAEREETHDLFIQNSENYQRIVSAFESLRKQAEANQQDMLKMRECLVQLEDLKMKLESECLMKDKEVAMLQERVHEREISLKEISLQLQEAQQNNNLLKESARQQQESLQNLRKEQESLEEKLKATEQLKWEIEENQRALTNKLEQSKENHEKVLQKKNSELVELNNIKEQQSNQLAEMHLTVNSLQSSLATETQRAQNLETDLASLLNELNDQTSELEEIKVQREDYGKQLQMLKDEQTKLKEIEEHLSGALERGRKSSEEVERLKKDIEQQKVQMDILSATIEEQNEKSRTAQEQLKENINAVMDESENAKKLYKEELQKISSDLKEKSTSEAQLNLEVKKLKQAFEKALKEKEDTEIKCQKKIQDMVTLMERYKHEYDKIVEEKDAELSDKRMREAEINAGKALLELELSHLQVENDELRKQLENVKDNKEILETASLVKDTHHEDSDIKLRKCKGRNSKTQKDSSSKRAVYTTPRNASPSPLRAVNEDPKTPLWSLKAQCRPTTRIKSFRIRTPPRPELTESWKTNPWKLDPKSDSSDCIDILSFSPRPVKSKKPMQPKDPEAESVDMFKKVQDTALCKSPATALKLAAIKRLRDSGWTSASARSSTKKKKIADKIFA